MTNFHYHQTLCVILLCLLLGDYELYWSLTHLVINLQVNNPFCISRI